MSTSCTIGVLGCGRHARRSHIAPLVALGADVLAWDPDPVARGAAKAAGARIASSEEEVFSHVEGVMVCSPDRFHTEALVEASLHSLPVLVEKPLCVTEHDLALVEEVLADPGAVVLSCHPRRYDPPFLGLQARLGGLVDELGPVKSLVCSFDYPAPRSDQLIQHASLLTDHFSHEFDLLEFLCGVPDLVDGRDRRWKADDAQVDYFATGSRSDGISYVFSGRRRGAEGSPYKETLEMTFAGGSLCLDANTGELVVTSARQSESRIERVGATDYMARFAGVNANFIDVVCGRGEPYLSADQIWRNTAATVSLDCYGSFTLYQA